MVSMFTKNKLKVATICITEVYALIEAINVLRIYWDEHTDGDTGG
jgi:hypothetical protein